MFTDPQSVTIDGTPISLPRVSVGNRTATYESGAGTHTMSISHTNGKRTRSVVRLEVSKNAADPFNPSTNRPYSMSTYLVVDAPPNVGFTDAELEDIVLGLTTKIEEAGFLAKFLGQES